MAATRPLGCLDTDASASTDTSADADISTDASPDANTNTNPSARHCHAACPFGQLGIAPAQTARTFMNSWMPSIDSSRP